MYDRCFFLSVFVVDDEMYVLCGYDGNDIFRLVECYSFMMYEWI